MEFAVEFAVVMLYKTNQIKKLKKKRVIFTMGVKILREIYLQWESRF